jgi:hypothetical protein
MQRKRSRPGTNKTMFILIQVATANIVAARIHALIFNGVLRTRNQMASKTRNRSVASTWALTHASKSRKGFQAKARVACIRCPGDMNALRRCR